MRMNTEAGASAAPGPNGAADSRLFVNSVEKGLSVLRAFRDGRRALTIAELAELTGLGRSATQRFVYTLHSLGYLRRDPRTRSFSLTARVLDLGYGFLRHEPLVEHATRYLSEIARFSEEAVSLVELDDLDIVVLSRVPSQHLFSVNVLQGMRFPAYSSAPGRAILAFLPEARARDVIDRSPVRPLTELTVTDRARLLTLLAETRASGYALADQETFLGTLSIGAPVFSGDGHAVAAINVFCPLARWSVERARAELAPFLLHKAGELSRAVRLG